MSGFAAQGQLRDLSRNFPVPEHGRYAREAAWSDENGVISLPPPVSDPVKRKAVLSAAGAAAVGVALWARSRRNNKKHKSEPGWKQVA